MWCFSDLKKFQDLIENDVFKGKLLDCSYNNLTSLKGTPKEIIYGSFNCSYNYLESLEYSPEKILYGFSCNCNKLKSLKGIPKIINENLYCYRNKLETLKGSPLEIKGNFDCSDNNLTSLKNCTTKIGGEFNCKNNNIINIKEEIIKNQIRAKKYETDEGDFYFEEIRLEFEEYNKKILHNKLKIKNNDYGLSI